MLCDCVQKLVKNGLHDSSNCLFPGSLAKLGEFKSQWRVRESLGRCSELVFQSRIWWVELESSCGAVPAVNES